MPHIYHLAPAARWCAWLAGVPYLPVEYAADGFVHCTVGDELMRVVANRFYRSAPGDFVLLVVDPTLLTSPLRWEPSAHPLAGAEQALAPLFPHIYGPIDRAAVVEVRPTRRSADGEFLGW